MTKSFHKGICRDYSTTVANAPSLARHGRTIHRRRSKIFCATSHMVSDNKLCAMYLIYRLDHLNYVMGSQLQRMVFKLLEVLSAVNMQLYVCRKKIRIILGSFGHFYTLS